MKKKAKNIKNIKNPIKDYWDIEIIYGYCQKTGVKKFVVKFTDKCIGNESFTLDWKEFRFVKKTMVERSGEIGVEIDGGAHTSIIDYVNYLKLSSAMERLSSKDTIEDHLLRSNKVAINNSLVLNEHVLDFLEEHREKLTTLKNNDFDKDVHLGCILDDEESIKEFDSITIAIPLSTLKNITNIEGVNEFSRLRDIWVSKKILITCKEKRSNGKLRNDPKIVLNSMTGIIRVCIMKIDTEYYNEVFKYD